MQRIGVLFVCLGNICRSPSAQAVFEERVARAGLAARFHADSYGTAAFNVGKPPDPRAVAVAERRGYRIAHQRARQIEDADFARFRYIVAMDHANLRTVQGWAPSGFEGEIRLLMHFAREVHAGIIVRGLRAVADFQYEFQMTAMNQQLDREISVIGMKKEIILERFLTQRPQPFKVAGANIQLQGVIIKTDPQGRCQVISRLQVPLKT